MLLPIIALGTFGATMLGGALALSLRDRLHLILGFSAGAVIAVAFFDLLPEALSLGGGYGGASILAAAAGGFLLYLLLDRGLLLHHPQEHGAPRAHARAGTLSLHSLLDGLGIGLAFQVSAPVGLVVAAAVVAHDFSDGINTVSVVVRAGGQYRRAMRWLMVDAIAPVVGIAAASFFSLSTAHLGLVLAVFGGFFLYIGASDLIPESHHAHPTFWTTLMTLVGAAVLFAAVHFAS
ncbi:MAG: ZIP family metal transporter [Patescibacteria group bacterium]|nr:ZIP family metal transporter [Patescibacteria group bacterium]